MKLCWLLGHEWIVTGFANYDVLKNMPSKRKCKNCEREEICNRYDVLSNKFTDSIINITANWHRIK